MLKLMFLNSWAGCLAQKYFSYIEECVGVGGVHVLCLQEVHACYDKQVQSFLAAKNPGHRRYPLCVKQYNTLYSRLGSTHQGYFAPQLAHSMHDLERTEFPINYGNAMFVQHALATVQYASGIIYRTFNQFHDGDSASRSIQSVSILHKGQAYLVCHFHGIWTENGKGDCEARIEQSRRVLTFLQHQKVQTELLLDMPVRVILGGDFNLSSDTAALQMLQGHKLFGEGGGVNLNAKFGVITTRTTHYPNEKLTREADFVIVSRDVHVERFAVPASPEVSDHRPLILTCS